MKNILLLFTLSMAITNCGDFMYVTALVYTKFEKPSYKITSKKIKSSKKIKEGFYLSEIYVTEYDEKGEPLLYDYGQTLYCGPVTIFSNYLAKDLYTDKEKDLIEDLTVQNKKILQEHKKNKEGNSKSMFVLIKNSNIIDSINNKYIKFNSRRVINLYKKNKNYRWAYTDDSVWRRVKYEKGLHYNLPETLKIEQWYMISFSKSTHNTNKVFFYVKKDGKIKQFHFYNSPIISV
ncbi:MAG: hypothetical protein JJU02_07850 [Cryomorphaceae bacterium]|nr:hypothetical protein [Cryomorphaceae bacterium]